MRRVVLLRSSCFRLSGCFVLGPPAAAAFSSPPTLRRKGHWLSLHLLKKPKPLHFFPHTPSIMTASFPTQPDPLNYEPWTRRSRLDTWEWNANLGAPAALVAGAVLASHANRRQGNNGTSNHRQALGSQYQKGVSPCGKTHSQEK